MLAFDVVILISENRQVIRLICFRFGYFEKGNMEDDFIAKLGGKVLMLRKNMI